MLRWLVVAWGAPTIEVAVLISIQLSPGEQTQHGGQVSDAAAAVEVWLGQALPALSCACMQAFKAYCSRNCCPVPLTDSRYW
jgi:hypothetical protein